ncbi:Fms-interacting protein-domain-containing protein [Tricharina praecox]|uniref:Fms-interacting protein-domain-containing protein n=1 Tax=Tricharina praecox TaxID=43433 RepID=UPI00221E5568|nr:Fms-interacting protein-domain-containing protein [Tricharina praecox]KAI5849985.1 Fms-interacting protein-domain-containing protein [Tricharina praecox]
MTVTPANIEDPTLQQCLEIAERTRQLCHRIVTTFESSNTSGDPDAQQNLIERSRGLKQLNALLQQLKCLHRTAVMSARDAKDVTRDARQEVDRLHLQLQNLYYEQRHLRGEITACIDFPHKYTSLPLISEEEFLAAHPEHAEMDAHNLMIARIRNEKVVREDLEKQRKELLATKQQLINENKKRKDDLANLDEQLKRFIESSRPIQTTFQKDY